MDLPLQLQIRALKEFEKFCERVKKGVENQSEEFLPALEIMLKNLERKGNTDEQIISGLNFFGIISAPSLISKEKRRPPLTQSPEEIIPLVYGREMITYGKRKCVEPLKNMSQLPSLSTANDNLTKIKEAKVGDG